MMQTFSIRDLRERSGELTREAEAGHLSLITKRGQPVMVTLPFSESLLDKGVKVALAEHLFKEGVLSLGKAAKVAEMPYIAFSEYLSRRGIPVVDYSPDELEDELRVANL
ncbi:MAG: type II toxin-antitoxin system prevent-host-death family antitoxin [Thiolinea sp.]